MCEIITKVPGHCDTSSPTGCGMKKGVAIFLCTIFPEASSGTELQTE
ncbi:MAG: hypothetical protein MG2_0020 [uncultured Candidatus Poseidoniales archaeon]|nr:MAG: hypothetical protein MG2_0020 [uncultured Candidatus Poseidoniales archaeon]